MIHIALNFQLPTDGALPDWLPLVPAGRFVGRDKRSWINDQPTQVVAYNRSLNREVVWDQEHATELKAPKGEPAPAVGWIKELDVREGQIWGRVEWNAEGESLIREKKYKYYSPAIICDANNRVHGISSVGLTNKHNLELPALNHQSTETEDDMSISAAIRQILALPETASDADAVVAIGNLKQERQVALNAQASNLEKFVPRADYDQVITERNQLRTELNSDRTARRDEEIKTLVDQAVEQKKISPATREYHVANCQQEGGIDRFKQFLASTPALLTDSGLDGKKPGDGAVALNSEQSAIAAMFGNSVEDVEKYGK
jgi:phage I-like protein